MSDARVSFLAQVRLVKRVCLARPVCLSRTALSSRLAGLRKIRPCPEYLRRVLVSVSQRISEEEKVPLERQVCLCRLVCPEGLAAASVARRELRLPRPVWLEPPAARLEQLRPAKIPRRRPLAALRLRWAERSFRPKRRPVESARAELSRAGANRLHRSAMRVPESTPLRPFASPTYPLPCVLPSLDARGFRGSARRTGQRLGHVVPGLMKLP
jgi:hypothetical protein